MKKLFVVIVLVIVLGLCLSVYNKKSDPIVLPATDEITSVEIANGIEDIICTEKEIITSFIQKVREAKPTAKESVQDVPSVLEYTRVDLVCNGNISSIFIYQEDSKWYIEQPYQGIYKTDETVLDLLEDSQR